MLGFAALGYFHVHKPCRGRACRDEMVLVLPDGHLSYHDGNRGVMELGVLLSPGLGLELG